MQANTYTRITSVIGSVENMHRSIHKNVVENVGSLVVGYMVAQEYLKSIVIVLLILGVILYGVSMLAALLHSIRNRQLARRNRRDNTGDYWGA